MSHSGHQSRFISLIVPLSAEGIRLDVFLLQYVSSGMTRGVVQKAIRAGNISVNKKKVIKPGSIVHAGQTITFLSDILTTKLSVPRIKPDRKIPLHILHEDPHLLVIDKQAGISVHSGARDEHPTIVDALVSRYPALTEVGEDPLRPGIVHRLDKDTSGVLLVARTSEMFSHLKRQFQLGQVQKTYLALVRGVIGEEEGRIALPIKRSSRNPLRRTVAKEGEGKPAVTSFRVRERFTHYTLLEVHPHTGRMHQIRVHLKHLGFPIVGDFLYGKQSKDHTLPPIRRQFLHASSLTVTLLSGKRKTFESSLPKDLEEILDALRERESQGNTRGRKIVRFRVPSARRSRGH